MLNTNILLTYSTDELSSLMPDFVSYFIFHVSLQAYKVLSVCSSLTFLQLYFEVREYKLDPIGSSWGYAVKGPWQCSVMDHQF